MGWSPFGFIPDLLSGKNPKQALEDGLKTAALTAAIVGTGGAAAGAAGTGAAAGSTMSGAASNAAFETALANSGGATAGAGSAGGLLGYVKPIGEAAMSANAVQGLLGGQPQAMQSHAPDAGNPQGSQSLSQLYQQGMQMSPEDQARMQRKTMWG